MKLAGLERELSDARLEVQKQNSPIRKLMQLKTFKKKRREQLGSKLAFACISSRNRFVKTRIQKDFRERQAKFAHGSSRRTKAGNIDVIPISSSAFWAVKSGGEPIPGFPRERYTGIPLVRDWLMEVLLTDREEHLDTIRNELAELRFWAHQWSLSGDGHLKIGITQKEVEKAMEMVHDQWNLVC